MSGIQPVSSASASTVSESESSNTYTVQHGDTLQGIAAAHGLSLAALQEANPQIHNPDVVYPGDHVNIPAGNSTSGASAGPQQLSQTNLQGQGQKSFRVVPVFTGQSAGKAVVGDSLAKIAEQFRLNPGEIEELKRLNPGIDFNKQLPPNTMIRVPFDR